MQNRRFASVSLFLLTYALRFLVGYTQLLWSIFRLVVLEMQEL